MLHKIVIVLTLTVMCVSSECNQGCKQYINRQYTRVKRGKYYSNPPIRFYNQPPMTYPIKGPFSYTPPPFKTDEPSYPGSRPYKVSKRPTLPTNNGLADEDITNLVKHLSKQDLDKILEFAVEKNQVYNKYKNIYDTESSRPYKRESKIVYQGNVQTKYEDPAPNAQDSKFSNYVTESTPTFVKLFSAQEDKRPTAINSEDRPSQGHPYETNNYNIQRVPNDDGRYISNQYVTSQMPISFPTSINPENPTYVEVIATQEPQSVQAQIDSKNYASNQMIPTDGESFSASQNVLSFPGTANFPSSNVFYSESNEEELLPRPLNMREEDYEVSYTNNVQKVVKPEPTSYNVENFGDLPLMDYNSKLHDVSSYHVPHYTVTQTKPVKPQQPVSFSSSSSYSSSTLLKPSPAAAAIIEPVYERAPSVAAAAEQSDAHLKATKIWSHKSKGAAYTLHDDGTLTPEWTRPKYG